MSKNYTIVSPARVAANQANAQLSTGPKTPESKALVSQNAVKHSMCSAKFVLKGEEQADFDKLHLALKDFYSPKTEAEITLVRQTAEYQWRLDRSVRIETSIFSRTIDEIAEANPEIGHDEALALIFMDPRYTSRIRLHMRYHGQIDRGWRKSISELEKLIKERERREAESAAEALLAPKPQTSNGLQNGGFVSYAAAAGSASQLPAAAFGPSDLRTVGSAAGSAASGGGR